MFIIEINTIGQFVFIKIINTPMSQCDIKFLDCRNYYDMSVQIISLFAVIFIGYRCIQNIRQLHEQKQHNQEIEYIKSIYRKMSVNIIGLVCLMIMTTQIIFSLTSFFLFTYDKEIVRQNKLNVWYKFIITIFISILNCLNLRVGFIYWKAIRGYYILSEIKLPIAFNKNLIILIWIGYLFNFIFIVLFLIYILLNENCDYSDQQVIVISVLTLIGVMFSTFLCMFCRFYYYTQILCNVRMSKLAFKKEKIYSIIILLSGILRLLLSIGDSTIDIDDKIGRQIDSQSCMDIYPYRALILLVKLLFINLTPIYIFSLIFTTFSQQKYQSGSKKSKSQSDKLLD